MLKHNRKAYYALLIGMLFLPVSPILIKLTGVPGITSSFFRLFFGSIVLTPFFILMLKRKKVALPWRGVLIAMVAGLCFAIDMSLWATGIMISGASLPTLTGNLAPVWVGITGYYLFKERMGKLFWAGLGVAIAVVSFLVIHDLVNPAGILPGLLLGLLAGIFYAAFMVLAQPGRKFLNTLSFLYISTVSTAVVLGVFMLVFKLPFTGYSPQNWFIFIFMGVFNQAGTWFLINYAQGYVPASIISPTLLTQPVLAAILATFVLAEHLSLWTILGGIIVMAGIYMVYFGTKKQ